MTEICPLCNGIFAKDFLRTERFLLVKCASCGLVRVNGFTANDTTYEGDEYFLENRYIENWNYFCQLFDSLLDKINTYKRNGAFLDVGCGTGCLISRAMERGFCSRGVEISPWAAKFACERKNLDVITGTLEGAEFNHDSFDVIVINHVLEHVPDPVSLLIEARRILKDDGLLVVGVPNIGSIMAMLAKSGWCSLRPDEHRWHFDPLTLKGIVSKCGFREIYFESKENHQPAGWGIRDIMRRIINNIAVITGRSEAMLLFCAKL